MMPTQLFDIGDKRDLARLVQERNEAGMTFPEKIKEAAQEAVASGMNTAEWVRQETERLVTPAPQASVSPVEAGNVNSYVHTLILGYLLGAVTVALSVILGRF